MKRLSLNIYKTKPTIYPERVKIVKSTWRIVKWKFLMHPPFRNIIRRLEL